MRRWLAVACAVAGAAALVSAPAAAQRSVAVVAPAEEPLRDGIPAFTVVASGFTAADLPLRFTLQVSTNPSFATGIVFDSTVTSAGGNTQKFVLRRLLPEQTAVYWRGVVTTVVGTQVNSAITGPRTTPAWLTLVTPNNPNGSTVLSKRPTFTWRSARVDASVGKWQYEIRITGPHSETVQVGRLDDTTYVPTRDLEGNTSYRWSVAGWLPTGDSTKVASAATFVVLDPALPPATVLFQNFPNPFPNTRVDATCVWFDLAETTAVTLEVLDLRGNRVRTLIPSAAFPTSTSFPAGRYGRASEGSNTGCDPRYSWDGTDDHGHAVPTGVYIIRLHTSKQEYIRKALYKGR